MNPKIRPVDFIVNCPVDGPSGVILRRLHLSRFVEVICEDCGKWLGCIDDEHWRITTTKEEAKK